MPEDAPAREPEQTPPPRRRARGRSAAEAVRSTEFPAAMRGYDRAAVDQWRDEVADLVERLEQQQPRDTAVRLALDQVGRETAAILQSAHDSADEIEARSRAQAEGRLRRAEREAEATIREAEEHGERLEADIRAVWEERARLIDDLRQLADEVLGVADDALDRLHPPAHLGDGEPDGRGGTQSSAAAALAPGGDVGVSDAVAPGHEGALEEPADEPTLEDPSEDPTLEDEPGLEDGPELGSAERATVAEPGEGAPEEADEDLTVEAPAVDPRYPGGDR